MWWFFFTYMLRILTELAFRVEWTLLRVVGAGVAGLESSALLGVSEVLL